MYNHYIPQSDGSFRRSSVAEPNRRPQAKPSTPPPQPQPQPQKQPPPPLEPPICAPTAPQSPLTFWKKLLPKQIDTADLIIIFLLLLISTEDGDDEITPLLTIALYFLL